MNGCWRAGGTMACKLPLTSLSSTRAASSAAATSVRSEGLWVRHCDTDTREGVEGRVSGTLPRWLNGRLIRNGPGGKHVGQHRYRHLFDGLSLLHLFDIKDGKAKYLSRYLESEAYKLNHRANRIIMSEFGTVGVPDPCLSLYDKCAAFFMPALLQKKRTDNCSVNVLQLKDQLVAMTELNIVRAVDPATLQTKPDLLQYSDYVSVHRATAHPHVEDSTVYNLGFKAGPGEPPQFAIVSLLDGQIENTKIVASVPCRWKNRIPYLHSFGITDNYYIIAETPMAFDIRRMMLPGFMGVSALDAMKYYKEEKTRFRIMCRKTGEEVPIKVYAPGFFNFHYINCFEADGKLVVDLCAADDNLIDYLKMDNLEKPSNDTSRKMCNVEPRRYIIPVENLVNAPVNEDLLKNFPEARIGTISPAATAVKDAAGDVQVTGVALGDVFMELPRINYLYNKKPYEYTYGASVSNFKEHLLDIDEIVKLNVKNGEKICWKDDEFFGSEPVFVRSPDGTKEDEGVLLNVLINKTKPKELALLVLDARNMQEMARVHFTAHGTVASTFHGQFIDADAAINSF
ncbi:Carotenoid oxygenase [Trinorchestia longiramus]|nr:Carotenoid oxygenase [Trinorchestia longiramus]